MIVNALNNFEFNGFIGTNEVPREDGKSVSVFDFENSNANGVKLM